MPDNSGQHTSMICTHTDTHTQTHTQTHTDAQRHTHTDTYRHTHRDTQRHTHRHTQTQRHTQTHKDTHIQTQRHTKTDTHTHTHTETHTHTHTHTTASRENASRRRLYFSVLFSYVDSKNVSQSQPCLEAGQVGGGTRAGGPKGSNVLELDTSISLCLALRVKADHREGKYADPSACS